MTWKLFAVAMTAFYGLGLADNPRDILDIVAMPIDGLASVGLLAYAFRLRRAYTRLWAPFAWFYAAWSVGLVSIGAIRGSVQGAPTYAIVGGLLIAAALQYLTWLALHRLGRAEYALTGVVAAPPMAASHP